MRRKQITLCLHAKLYKLLTQVAEQRGMQLNEVMSIILYEHFFGNADQE